MVREFATSVWAEKCTKKTREVGRSSGQQLLGSSSMTNYLQTSQTIRWDANITTSTKLRTLLPSVNVDWQVGFTLSQATKALRESRRIALLYFRPLHWKGVRGQRHAPAAPYHRERRGTHCTGGWVGLRAGLDWCGKSRPTGIRSPDPPARRHSLYRLRYPAHFSVNVTSQFRDSCPSQNADFSSHVLRDAIVHSTVNSLQCSATLYNNQSISPVLQSRWRKACLCPNIILN